MDSRVEFLKNQKILIGSTSFGDSGDKPAQMLNQSGLRIINNPKKRKLTAEEVIEYAQDCLGILAGSEPLTAEVLNNLPNLRCISRFGVGLDNVDIEAAKGLNIQVFNTPDALTQAVAEFALATLLSLLRGIPLADRNIRRGVWRKETGVLLSEKVIGIIGLGRIGRAFAEKLLALGCHVLATDPAPDDEWLTNHPIAIVELDTLLKSSDVISLHLLLLPETVNMIGKTQFALMKPSSFFVNLSRGGIVNEDALVQAINDKTIAGAAIDVFEKEPYEGPLLDFDNVILTPHMASRAREAKLRMEIEAVENLLDGVMQSINNPSRGN